jgi:hypothetical protein
MDLTQMTFAAILVGGLGLSFIGGGWTYQRFRNHHIDWSSRPRTLANIYSRQQVDSARKLAVPLLLLGLAMTAIGGIGLAVAYALR